MKSVSLSPESNFVVPGLSSAMTYVTIGLSDMLQRARRENAPDLTYSCLLRIHRELEAKAAEVAKGIRNEVPNV